MAMSLRGERSDGEPTKKVSARTLLSVEYLKVIGPSDRPDDLCSIYGYFRVSDKKFCALPVTLFDRRRDEAETIDLGQPLFQFIPLSDNDSARPVLAGSCRFYVQMKFWEKIGHDQVNDRLLVEVDFEFDDFKELDKRSFLDFKGNFGFNFSMAHSHIYDGVCAEVRFTIVKDIAPPAGAWEVRAHTQITGKRKHHSGRTIYGTIEAIQSIKDEFTTIEMFYAHISDPVPVDIGSPVVLQRKLLVVPTDGGCVGISYSLHNAANDQLITTGTIPFRIREDIRGVITAPGNLTYTQQSEDGIVSASITLVPYTYDP